MWSSSRESGERIEEITLTYVVVRIWDLRRLVVPITYFIEKPFQNWTRTSADILGTVCLRVDYGVPVDAVRQELTRILNASPNWDHKVNVLQVTDCQGTDARTARACQLERQCRKILGPALRDARKARGVHPEELSGQSAAPAYDFRAGASRGVRCRKLGHERRLAGDGHGAPAHGFDANRDSAPSVRFIALQKLLLLCC